MDYSVILRPVVDTATWLTPAMLLLGLLKSPWAKGQIDNALTAAAPCSSAPRNQARKQGSRSGAARRFPSADQAELFKAQGTIENRGLALIIITFGGGGTFKTEVPANVTQGIGFIRYIQSFQQPVFSAAEVDAMLHALQTGRRAPTLATHREHVQNLKRRSDPTAERQCPKCGSALVIRNVKSGAKAGQQFWGCSGCPKFRTMQSI